MTRTHLSLFSGIGGIDLAAHRAGFATVAFCERDAFCRAVLENNFGTNTPLFDDVRTVTARALWERGVDWPFLASGGFPCQDVSGAGRQKGLGTEAAPTDRSGLWFAMLGVIRDCRPRYVLVENVAHLVHQGIDVVLGGLEALDYTCWAGVMGADAVGAPHQRNRIFIVGFNPGNDGTGWGSDRGWAAAGVAQVRGDACRCRCGGDARRGTRPESADGHSRDAGVGGCAWGVGHTDAPSAEQQGDYAETLRQRGGATTGVWREDLRRADGAAGADFSGPSDEDLADTDCSGRLEQQLPLTGGTAHAASERGGVCRPGDVADADGEWQQQPGGLLSEVGRRTRDPGPFMADAACVGHERARGARRWLPELADGRGWPSRPGQSQHEWEAPRTVESPLGASADGFPAGLVRSAARLRRLALQAAGNAVVPAQVYPVLRAIAVHADAQERSR